MTGRNGAPGSVSLLSAGIDGGEPGGAGRDGGHSVARAAMATLAARNGGVLTGGAGDGLTAAFARPGDAAGCALTSR